MSMDTKKFIKTGFALKHLARAGWKRVGIEDPESVASHSWGISVLISLLSPPHLNKLRMYEMALAHDMPEVITGDITPHDNISSAEKKEREKTAAQNILPLPLYNAWLEYEENTTLEAQFVHMLDKLDMALQAQIYAKTHNTDEFIVSALCKIPLEIQEQFGLKKYSLRSSKERNR